MNEQIGMFAEPEKTNKDTSLIEEMKGLIETLNEASLAYYQEAREIMPNYEYDRLYDRLQELEKETGTVFSNSPTQNVGYEVLSELPKEAHPSKMLSLDKTKEPEALRSFVGDHEALMSWKLDGLTVVLTYNGGTLVKAVTRGNGEVGEVITNNARVFSNVPLNIDFKGELVLRGEAVITYDDFEKINSGITDEGSKYKNPRNLCSGSVRQLDPRITKQRGVKFFAFALVSAEGKDFVTRSEQFDWLEAQGFQVVEHKLITGSTVEETIEWFADHIADNPVPSDGLVVSFNDIEYGRSLGVTAKFPRDSIAFKWQDETAETELKEIEWSASRTGLINPVAIFELKLGIGDRIRVYKANMIIPQIAENLTGSGNVHIPETCPVCGGDTIIKSENGVETLNCPNPECPAKQIKGFSHFVSRDAMNIEGLSESTLEKLIDRGLIREFADIFRIDEHHDEIVVMEGFGELSFRNLCDAVEKARKVTPQAFLYSLGIPNFGRANAGLVSTYCRNDWDKIRSLEADELVTIEGIGSVMAEAYVSFFKDEKNAAMVDDLLSEVELDTAFEEAGELLKDMTFVITGSLETYPNRDALKAEIEANGGKVAGSVSAKTSYLINNDLTSNSGKNKKAKELGIPIISEMDMVSWLKEGKKP